MTLRMSRFSVDNPATGALHCERDYIPARALPERVRAAHGAHVEWRRVPLSERIELVMRVREAFKRRLEPIAADITAQMGKPIDQARGEVKGMLFRTRSLCDQAEAALAPRVLDNSAGFDRKITREPLGVVLDIAAWNYPLLVPVNVVAAAVLAGNSVIIKHSPRTPLCAEAFQLAFEESGAPDGLVTALHVDHPTAAELIAAPEVGYVSFTGSLRGGLEVYSQVAKRVLGMGLELGGKDAAYVRADADLDFSVANTAEGAFYNAGQSCCAIERIYVADAIYDDFVERFAAHVRETWTVGDPTADGTAIGPMALPGAPQALKAQVVDAVERGGRLLLGGEPTRVDGAGRYFEPTVVADATNDMTLMRDESFGPVIGIARVSDDEDAVRQMNSSEYGLTASVWTTDSETAWAIGDALDVGTVFLNRCDYLDPELPWTGVKQSGLGSSLSHLGFEHVTRPKAWHFRQ